MFSIDHACVHQFKSPVDSQDLNGSPEMMLCDMAGLMCLCRTTTHLRNVAKKFETLRAHAQAFCLSREAKF